MKKKKLAKSQSAIGQRQSPCCRQSDSHIRYKKFENLDMYYPNRITFYKLRESWELLSLSLFVLVTVINLINESTN